MDAFFVADLPAIDAREAALIQQARRPTGHVTDEFTSPSPLPPIPISTSTAIVRVIHVYSVHPPHGCYRCTICAWDTPLASNHLPVTPTNAQLGTDHVGDKGC